LGTVYREVRLFFRIFLWQCIADAEAAAGAAAAAERAAAIMRSLIAFAAR
jgi:hypothetical protein